MITVKLFGQPTSTYEFTKKALIEEVARAGVEMTLKEINDVNEFIKEGIKSVPTIKINNHFEINYSGRDEMAEFLRQSIQSILKEEDFGKIQKIVVPTDFSECSRNALRYALRLFSKRDSVLKIVHAYHPLSGDINGISVVDPHMENQKRAQLNVLLDHLKESNEVDEDAPFLDEQFRIGYAGDEVVAMSKNEDVDLIVMGSTGKGKTFKKWFGSVSLEVAKKSKCPVLIVPPDGHFEGFKNIVYATDQATLDAAALFDLLDFLNREDFTLHLSHVATPANGVFQQEQLAEKLRLAYPERRIVSRILPEGDVVESLGSYAEKVEADLMVMTKEKRNLWEDITHPSATRKMAINSKLPLLIYHANDLGCCCGKKCRKPAHSTC